MVANAVRIAREFTTRCKRGGASRCCHRAQERGRAPVRQFQFALGGVGGVGAEAGWNRLDKWARAFYYWEVTAPTYVAVLRYWFSTRPGQFPELHHHAL